MLAVTVFAVSAALAAALGACSDSPDDPFAKLPELDWRAEPLGLEWVTEGWRPVDHVIEYHQGIADRVRAEVEYCERHGQRLLNQDEFLELFPPGTDRYLMSGYFTPVDNDELAWIEQVALETAARREIELESLPTVVAVAPDRLRRHSCYWLEQAQRDQAPVDPDALWEFERLIGLIPEEWTPALLEHLGSLWTAGWYGKDEHGEPLIVLVSELPLAESVVSTVTHELVHALQDQLLDGALHDRYGEGTSDQSVAYSWVVEGDASVSELGPDDPFTRQLLESRSWGAHEAPIWWTGGGITIAEIGMRGFAMAAPYTSGKEYVAELRQSSGWAAVNELLRDPLDSSEQLRHPDKREADEPPLPVAPLLELRNLVLGLEDERAPYADTRGEQALIDLIAFATTDEGRSATAGAGWGIDAFSLSREFDGAEATVVVWQIAFDDEREHREGFAGLREWIVHASGARAVSSADGRAIAWNWTGGRVRLVDGARLVWLIATDDRADTDLITQRILALPEPEDWWAAAEGADD